MDHEFRELLPLFHMVIQPELKLRRHKSAHEFQSVAARQLILCLSLELRIQHLAGKHIGRAGKDVFREKLHALHGELMRVDEVLHRLKETVLQAIFMRAA